MAKIQLGSTCTDSLTGLTGVVTARIEYINGCISYEIQPTEVKDGQIVDSTWVDEQRLTSDSGAVVGGPGSLPPSPSTPNR